MTQFITYHDHQIAIIHHNGLRWLNGDHVLHILYGRVTDRHYTWIRSMLPENAFFIREIKTSAGIHTELLMSYWAALILSIKSTATDAQPFRDYMIEVIEADLSSEPDPQFKFQVLRLEQMLERYIREQEDKTRQAKGLLSKFGNIINFGGRRG